MPIIDWKQIIKDVVEKSIFPAIDKFVTDWKPPFDPFDDAIWGVIKSMVQKWIDSLVVVVRADGCLVVHHPDGNEIAAMPKAEGGFDIKALLQTICATWLFPRIDALTQKWNTPWQLDDAAWKLLRRKIEEALDMVIVP